jgi:hypothetical protein
VIEDNPTPTARAELFWVHTQWQACIAEVAPPQITSRILYPDRRYFLEVAITLPESDINYYIGMFMLHVSLRDRNETLLASSKRATMLPYESSFIKAVRKLVLVMPILLGAVTEARTVVVGLFDHFIENIERPLSSVEVRLILPAQRTTSSFHFYQSLQIDKAELRIGKELNSLQYVMKEWFYTCAFILTTIFMAFQLLGLLVYWRFSDQHKRLHLKPWGYDDDSYSLASGRLSLAGDSTSFFTRADEGDDNFDEDDVEDTTSTNDETPVEKDCEYKKQSSFQTDEDKCSSMKKKKSNVSSDKSELRARKKWEKERLERILRGDFESSFHIFTGECSCILVTFQFSHILIFT